MTNTPPNILWIQTDEQRVDSLGCYGSEWAKTPNLDALAERGVVFERCFCPSPVCIPSRSSQLAARYPQECNTVLNTKLPFPSGIVTFPEVLAAAGYQTVSFGKSHTPPHPTWQHHEDFRHFRKYSAIRALGDGYDPKEYGVVQDEATKLILGGTYPGGDDNPSRCSTDRGIDFLRTHDGAAPFLLRVSHLWPHTPVLAPRPFDTLYTPDEIPIRAFDEEAWAARGRRNRTWSSYFGLRNMSREDVAHMWTTYMGLCAYVDHEVGRLLEALDKAGLAENTIILYSADHGRQLGEYGGAEKHTFDDIVWRVPFLLAWPGHLPGGTRRTDLCNLVDTGRTLTGLAGLADAAPATWRGRDLFHDPIPPEAEQAAFGQIGFPDSNSSCAVYDRARDHRKKRAIELLRRAMRVGIRTSRYRMDVDWMADGQRLSGSELDGNLFDLDADPLERVNLFEQPEHASTVDALQHRIATWFDTLHQPQSLFPK